MSFPQPPSHRNMSLFSDTDFILGGLSEKTPANGLTWSISQVTIFEA